MTTLQLVSASDIGLCDIIFVHGLDGDPNQTWLSGETTWPQMVADSLPSCVVWSLGYDASSSGWRGTAMPLMDRSINVLAILQAYGIGHRPVVFVAHSLGGLLVKQMLRHGIDHRTEAWTRITKSTKGVVFLATPHTGSRIASFLRVLRIPLWGTALLMDLVANNQVLRDLNTWFRNNAVELGIKCQAYFETQGLFGFFVVDQASADPGLPGVVCIPWDGSHRSICKPVSSEDVLHRRLLQFIRDCCGDMSVSGLHYNIYCSETKLQMLWGQLGSEGAKPAPGAMLARLHAWLKAHDRIGTLSDPKEYIAGTIDMRFGYVGSKRVVFFAGTQENTLIGLIGSSASLIGADAQAPRIPIADYETVFLEEAGARPTDKLFPYGEVMKHALAQASGPIRTFTFLARVVHCEDRLIIGTPVVVSELAHTPLHSEMSRPQSAVPEAAAVTSSK